jgi:hypothetical protein
MRCIYESDKQDIFLMLGKQQAPMDIGDDFIDRFI